MWIIRLGVTDIDAAIRFLHLVTAYAARLS